MKTDGLPSSLPKQMRIAALDIGTNTILLLLAEVDSKGKITVLHNDYLIPRLGRGVDKNKSIDPANFDLAVESLASILTIAKSFNPDELVACGTSFLRDALNAVDFLEHIRDRLGVEIRVLDGNEEARLTYLGAVSSDLENPGVRDYAVIDIGGGSTELIHGGGSVVRGRWSMNVGCVRLTERILGEAPPSREQLDDARLEIRSHIPDLEVVPRHATLIGVAGTLTTLAALDLKLLLYDPVRVTGHVLSKTSIRTMFSELSTMSLPELQSYPQILAGRADILVAGILILLEVMDAIGAEQITASDRGLRYGMVVDCFQSRAES